MSVFETTFFNTGIGDSETFKYEITDKVKLCLECRFCFNYPQVAPCLDCQSNSLREKETQRQYFQQR
jgi:hypothetical protein